MTRPVKSYGVYIAIAATAATIMGSAAGCGGAGVSMAPAMDSSSGQTPQPQAHMQSLDTAQVLEQARHASETAAPYSVDSGALTLIDTSDSTNPLVFVPL